MALGTSVCKMGVATVPAVLPWGVRGKGPLPHNNGYIYYYCRAPVSSLLTWKEA